MAGTDGPSLNCGTIEEYQSDPRIACKYGIKCYQKNPVHVSKYKHPPKQENIAGKKGTKRFKKASPSRETVADASNNTEDDAHISESDDAQESGSPKRKLKNLECPEKDCLKGESSGMNNHSSASQDQEQSTSSSGTYDFDSDPEMPPSPSDVRMNIKQKFLFEMPDDFYSFWDFCQSLNGPNPSFAFKDVGLQLVGPYDLLSSNFTVDKKKRKQSLYLLHWRYYYDPPGFQTVIKGDDKKQFHIGYFRDEPKSLPVFLASNCAAEGGTFKPIAENIFGAVNAVLSDMKKTVNPFLQTKVSKLQKALQDFSKENNFTLDTKTQAMKQRERKTVSKTFNGLGLLVPVEKKTEVGYRELILTDSKLKKILSTIVESDKQELKDKASDQLQEVITAANIANDECDFGTSVELGLDLFAFGADELDRSALQLLTTGYSLLGRSDFVKIAQVHIKNRRKGSNLDMLSS